MNSKGTYNQDHWLSIYTYKEILVNKKNRLTFVIIKIDSICCHRMIKLFTKVKAMAQTSTPGDRLGLKPSKGRKCLTVWLVFLDLDG